MRETETETDRQRQKQRHTEIHKQTDRGGHTDRQRQKQRDCNSDRAAHHRPLRDRR